MFGWLRTKSPLGDDQRAWIDAKLTWLIDQFGKDHMLRAVITPTDEFFPARYQGTPDDAKVVLGHLCEYMNVELSRLELSFYKSTQANPVRMSFDPGNGEYALGAYAEEGSKARIWIEETQLSNPSSVVATLAHELGHVHLLGDRRYPREAEDHEPLTDLTTIFFGLGIFTANSVIRETNWRSGQLSGWSVAKAGYLSVGHYAYALARFALERGENKPSWIKFLRADVKGWMKTELKELIRGGTTTFNGIAIFSNAPSETNSKRDDEDEENDSDTLTNSPDIEDDTDTNDAKERETAAESDFNDEISDVPDSQYLADDWFTEGVILFNERNYEEAICRFTEALRLKPHDGEIRLHRAEAFKVLRQYDKVIDDCKLILDDDPKDAAALALRGYAFLYQKKYASAGACKKSCVS